MSSPTITARLPVVEREGRYIVAVIGHPTVEAGEDVVVNSVRERRRLSGVLVDGFLTAKARDLPAATYEALRATTAAELVDGLSRAYGTRLPESVTVTIYELKDRLKSDEPTEPANETEPVSEEVAEKPVRLRRRKRKP